MPRSRAGLITSRTSWLRLASKRSNSVSGVMLELCGANCKSSRMLSPIGVPPGSRVSTHGTPDRWRRAVSLSDCVDFPLPSDPSNVMNGSRGMISLVRRRSSCKDVFQDLFEAGNLEYMKQFWLVKQEPSSYSWSDFVADGETSWTGVRNFAARNSLRKMQKSDEVLFYHSGEE